MQEAMNLTHELKTFLKNLRTFVKNGGRPGLGDVTQMQQISDKLFTAVREIAATTRTEETACSELPQGSALAV